MAPDNPYKPLPGDARLRVAIRRTLRVGKRAGTPVEDLGVTPDELHRFTRNDLLSGNQDLIERAGQLLKNLPKRRLKVVAGPHSPPQLSFVVDTKGLHRLDIFGDGRPEGSIDLTDGVTEIKVPDRGFSKYEFRGYSGGALVASHRSPK